MRRSVTAWVVATFLATTSLAALAHGPAQSSPGPGETVGGEVDEVVVVFAERMTEEGLSVQVRDEAGNPIPGVGGPTLENGGQVVRYSFEPLAEAGLYRVDYFVSARDGVESPGAYLFVYEPSAPPPAPVEVPEIESGANWPLFALGLGVAAISAVAYRKRTAPGD